MMERASLKYISVVLGGEHINIRPDILRGRAGRVSKVMYLSKQSTVCMVYLLSMARAGA